MTEWLSASVSKPRGTVLEQLRFEHEDEMKPMFLPGVENNPEPGPYYESLQTMRASGEEYPQIWHLFAFRPRATEHLARFTQEIMRGPAPIEPGLRELIAAYTSRLNHCPF